MAHIAESTALRPYLITSGAFAAEADAAPGIETHRGFRRATYRERLARYRSLWFDLSCFGVLLAIVVLGILL